MLIKSEEYEKLRAGVSENEKQYETTISDLRLEVAKLKKEIVDLNNFNKPDQIIVKFLEYREVPNYMYGTTFIAGEFQIESSIKLSGGIRNQVYSMLRSIKDNFSKKFEKALKVRKSELKKESDTTIRLEKNRIAYGLAKIIGTHNFFFQSKLKEEITDLYNSLINEK